MKISLDKTIRAMSIALDLAEMSSIENKHIVEKVSNVKYSEHAFLHHSTRTTYIALELGKILNIEQKSFEKLYISSLIHDIGAANTLYESHTSEEFVKSHCKTGSDIVSNFPIFNDLSEIILYHHENWNGSGNMHIQGSAIPIESQIIRIADLIALLFKDDISIDKQQNTLINWVKSNSNIIFSEKIANNFLNLSRSDMFWFNIQNIHHLTFMLDKTSPKLDLYLNINQLEVIANIFANIIDKKSTFTAKHSREIAELAYKVSKNIGYSEEKSQKMKIAGLLHDIGKLAIPTSILDKNGPLTSEEFSIIKSHAYFTKVILDRIEDIPDISDWASNHHEKLNGNGYPRNLTSFELSEESRILGVCDIYQALTEDRPYRKGLSKENSFSIIDSMVDDGFICEKAVKYLKDTIN
jgi:putative nucleotidyltransferase with HDIG domain